MDDHPICVEAIEIASRHISEDLVAEQASSLSQMSARMRSQKYDAVFLDLSLPDAKDLEAVRTARELQPDCATAIVTSSLEPHIIRDAIALGVKAYISKALALDELRSGITVVLHGGIFYSDDVLKALSRTPAASEGRVGDLSRMQRRVLAAAASGQSNQAIGDELGIALATVKSHLSEAYRILGVRNRNEAILSFQRHTPS